MLKTSDASRRLAESCRSPICKASSPCKGLRGLCVLDGTKALMSRGFFLRGLDGNSTGEVLVLSPKSERGPVPLLGFLRGSLKAAPFHWPPIFR